jgi:hypothetical protein
VDFIRRIGFKRSNYDPCLFIRDGGSAKTLIVLYVDDGLAACSDSSEITRLMDYLKQEFQITVGSLDSFLGMQIRHLQDGSIWIGQTGYCEKILEWFGFQNARTLKVPAEREGDDEDGKRPLDPSIPYNEAVGRLQYLSTTTRPDIAFAVGFATRHRQAPTVAEWRAVERIYRYLRGSTGLGLLFPAGAGTALLEAYSDAAHADDKETCRSTLGLVCQYNHTAIIWASRLQRAVRIDTMGAEYVAASECAIELVWVKRLLREISNFSGIPAIKIDNQAAIAIIKNPMANRRSKSNNDEMVYKADRKQGKVFSRSFAIGRRRFYKYSRQGVGRSKEEVLSEGLPSSAVLHLVLRSSRWVVTCRSSTVLHPVLRLSRCVVACRRLRGHPQYRCR